MMAAVTSFAHRDVFGPFHRRQAPTQDAAAVVAQVLSGELWGYAPNFGGPARVQAYNGPLPADHSGIQFWAFQAPDQLGPRVGWRQPGPFVSLDAGQDVVKLQIAFVTITQDLHP